VGIPGEGGYGIKRFEQPLRLPIMNNSTPTLTLTRIPFEQGMKEFNTSYGAGAPCPKLDIHD
jgi:hypothetical protein